MARDGLFFSGESLLGLAADLRGAAAALIAEAPATLERVGKHIESNAKNIAGSNGSTSIPDTITGGLRGPLEYRIRAGNENVALAGLWELGNANTSRSSPTFRHPVFGTDVYVDQPRYPFLRPALVQDRAMITAEMEAMWDRALTPWRLRPSSSSLVGAVAESTVVNLS